VECFRLDSSGISRGHGNKPSGSIKSRKSLEELSKDYFPNKDCTLHSFLFQWLHSPCRPWPLCFSFLIYTRAVGLLERVISSSQGLYLNTLQHKHRMYVCMYMYVYSRGGPQTAPAPRPSLIYCASPILNPLLVPHFE
jgi:hypothetical protein